MEPKQLTALLKGWASELGFDAVGVAPASAIPPDNLADWIQRGYQGEMSYMERNLDKRLDPQLVLEGARSVVSVALNYFHPYEPPCDQSSLGVVSRYASGDDYHDVLDSRLRSLLQRLCEAVPGARGKVYVDTGPVMDKVWAQRSGIGWLGKHTNILARGGLGSWFFLGEILLNLELEYDSPARDHCGSCTACITSCPTSALVEPYVLDSRLCIAYLTIELRGDIPEPLRPLMGNLVFGCDICQDVCPWNRKAKPSRLAEFAPRPGNRAPALEDLAALSDQEFESRFHKSPVRRARRGGLLRNVAVAIGNSGQSELIPVLQKLLEDDDAMVRRHAAWALLAIGSADARSVLKEQFERENDPATQATLLELMDRA